MVGRKNTSSNIERNQNTTTLDAYSHCLSIYWPLLFILQNAVLPLSTGFKVLSIHSFNFWVHVSSVKDESAKWREKEERESEALGDCEDCRSAFIHYFLSIC